MRIVVTGATGFIGQNLLLYLDQYPSLQVLPLGHADPDSAWASALTGADAVIHLAGVNRPRAPSSYDHNATIAERLAHIIERVCPATTLVYASSSRATELTPYGASKLAAENTFLALSQRKGTKVRIFRLPNVFGKWARPNYNSAVATFCHNIARGLPIQIHDAAAPISIVYIDDVVRHLLSSATALDNDVYRTAEPTYLTTVGQLADSINSFARGRDQLEISEVGAGLTRALYATYVSYLPPDSFSRRLVVHSDPRGGFCEVLKTALNGQFSFFTALPGVTRGGHYHHTKTEKFVVVEGTALFRFRHIITNEIHEIRVTGSDPTVVDTIPGWAHDITNVGSSVLICLLWANEVFDPKNPDTVSTRV